MLADLQARRMKVRHEPVSLQFDLGSSISVEPAEIVELLEVLSQVAEDCSVATGDEHIVVPQARHLASCVDSL